MNLKTIVLGERKYVSFCTKLGTEELVTRFKSAIAKERGIHYWQWIGDFAGQIAGRTFIVTKITRPPKGFLETRAGNVWNPVYYGKFIALPQYTLIKGYFDVPLIIKIWSGIMLLITLIGLIFFISFLFINNDPNYLPTIIIGIVIATLILIIMTVWARYGIIKGREEYKPILEFLKDTFDAVPNDDAKEIIHGITE